MRALPFLFRRSMSSQKTNLTNPAVLIATFGGVGWLPRAPGTWASLASLPIGWRIIAQWGPTALAAASTILFFLGVWACNRYEILTGVHDASSCVVDEVVGQWLVLLVVPLDPVFYVCAFFAFRFFDIVKPWPTGWVDRRLLGGLGIMLDDVVAGAQAGIVLWAVESSLRHFL